MTACRHCGGEITPCTGHEFCKGWKHVTFLHYGPVGPHYCEGRSVNPMAEPLDDEDRRRRPDRDEVLEAEVRDQYRDLGLDEDAIAAAMSAARDAGMFDVPDW